MPRTRRSVRTAANSDKHELYQLAVQAPDAELSFVDRVFRRLRQRRPVHIREDFCGTALTSCEWVKRHRQNTAVGLDLHQPTLNWGLKHNASKLTDDQRARLRLLRRNVLTPGDAGPVDAVLAMNFSYFILKERAAILRYFSAVRGSLVGDGVFFLDIYGGWEAHKSQQERRRVKGFTYVWDQASYNPITQDKLAFIHFEFKKGPPMRRAFSYRWRLYSPPEVRDILADAGFRKTRLYWEGDDGKGGGNGVFREQEVGDECASFIAYITAEK